MLTGKQLEVYLAYAVHGRKPPQSETRPARKPIAKARTTARRGPPRCPALLAWIRQQPSIISGLYGCDACHTGTDGGMGMKASDLSCVPMTRTEHLEYHRIGREAFARKYRVNFAREAKRHYAEWRAHASRKSA